MYGFFEHLSDERFFIASIWTLDHCHYGKRCLPCCTVVKRGGKGVLLAISNPSSSSTSSSTFSKSQKKRKNSQEKKIRKIITENCQIKIVENCRKIEIARKHRKYKEMMKIKIIDTGGCPIMPKGVKNGQTHFTPLL